MTIEQRNAEILRILAERTKANTASPERARADLISEGIYTAKGNLRAQFGGRGAKTAA